MIPVGKFSRQVAHDKRLARAQIHSQDTLKQNLFRTLGNVTAPF